MARLYLTLYGLLFVTVGLFIAGIVWLPEQILHGTIQRYYERALVGAYELVEEQLVPHPQDEWDEVIAGLQRHFRHGLELYELKELEVDETERRRLQAGQLVFKNKGEQTRFFKRVADSKRYLMLVLGLDAEQKEVDQVEGIVYLVERRFLDRDPADWPAVLAELGRVFKMPLALLLLDDAALPEDRLVDIKAGKTVVLGLEEQRETYYKRLGASDRVFRAGPLEIPWLLRYFNALLLVVLALLIALAVYVWVRPMWRDLKRLDRGVRFFGGGDLATRLLVRKGSALKPLVDTFNGMADRLQRLIVAHRELTGAVSHELRTPIARLRFRLDMLEEPLSEEDAHRHMDGMRKDLAELEELVSESLSYSRLDSERPELVLELVNLQDWLQALLIELEDEMSSVTVELVSDTQDESAQVKLDSRLMARAVKNLLRNARRHASNRIILSCDCTVEQASIRVEDDGKGVPEQERERIFEPFARLDAARDRESGGVGLGLAIVSQIARWHTGKAWVEDSSLGGACFVIAWPQNKNERSLDEG